MDLLGIDVGGTGIKGAIIDTDSGQLISERKDCLHHNQLIHN